ncbi:hypothetical protein BRD03_08820 [Halobacteriales archaeon QS_9_68_17]|nr:MAG: hypothetical protein BRD03_08820 [Halobacteriales archaeon QS_9_68_17]
MGWLPVPMLGVNAVRRYRLAVTVGPGVGRPDRGRRAGVGRLPRRDGAARARRDRRGLNAAVISGGVDLADSVHDEVVDALREEGIDIADRAPRRISPDDIGDADYLVTIGCSADQSTPDGWAGESRV